MAEFALHSFCKACGAHKLRMPSGDSDPFWDRRPCRKCGEHRPGRCVVAREARVGGWPWQRGWVTPFGERADVPAVPFPEYPETR